MNAKRKKILSTYRLIVYEDGSTDLIPDQIFLEKPKEDDKEEKKCSQRILQIVAVLKETLVLLHSETLIREEINVFALDKMVTMAVNNVSKCQGLSVPTVLDKCTRQLNLNKADFVMQLEQALYHVEDYKEADLYKAIYKKCLNVEDVLLLKEVFREICTFGKKDEK